MNAAGTILLVEDEVSIRKLVRTALLTFGFQNVIDADRAERAIQLAGETPTPITLLLSDINLGSSMDGIELARVITGQTPDASVLLMSGGADPTLMLAPGWHFIAKPFSVPQLLDAVRNAFDANPVEVRQATADLTVFTVDLEKTIVPSGAILEDFRMGPGHEGLLPSNPGVASFHCDGRLYFNLAREIVGKTRAIIGRQRLNAA
jgi:DNA-binding NtrC family response regulator